MTNNPRKLKVEDCLVTSHWVLYGIELLMKSYWIHLGEGWKLIYWIEIYLQTNGGECFQSTHR